MAAKIQYSASLPVSFPVHRRVCARVCVTEGGLLLRSVPQLQHVNENKSNITVFISEACFKFKFAFAVFILQIQ